MAQEWDKVCLRPRNARERRECRARGYAPAGSCSRPYPAAKTAEVRLEGLGELPKRERGRWERCRAPSLPQGSDLEQWTVLHRKPGRKKPVRLTCSFDAFKYLQEMGKLPQEELVAIYLDNKNAVVGTSMISRGTASETVVNPADVFRPGIISNATRFMVAHNHPSGDANPSPQDAAFTKRLKEAGEQVGMTLLDSLVVGDGQYTSLRDIGVLR